VSLPKDTRRKKPETNLNLFSSNNHEQTYEPRVTISTTVTRSGAGIDLPGFGHARNDMSDHEDDAPAARGTLGSRARRTADRDDDRHRPWRKSDFPSDDAAFERCRVKSHEDFPRHIYRLFLVLGIQEGWLASCDSS
jgi:hypothetical protein